MVKLAYMVPAGTVSPEWADSTKTRINITVSFPHLGGEEVRYTAAKSDPGWEHSEEIFARAAAGEFGEVAEYAAPPEPVPFDVSRAQFGREMRERGLFSQADAIAFVTGTGIPAALQSIIDKLESEDARDDAALLILGAARIERQHPLTTLMAAGLGWSCLDTDDFFRAAGAR